MVWISNIIFYNLFRFEKATQKVVSFPFQLVLRNKKIRESYIKRGVDDPESEVIRALENPEFGISSILAGGHFIVLFSLLIFGLLNLFFCIFKLDVRYSLVHFGIVGILSYLFAHLISFRKDRYLEYFNDFEKLPKNKKMGYAWMTFFIVLGVWAFGVGSFIFLNYRV